ncbi:hypothetical protein DIURU_003293 [Diutina rugosa]|uniref:Mitochondrial genome maintenance protein MGM101 n=1 Tax=Diutina rugosa TaxID=5481 RepID=A0A642ULF2_DIURU|nr:uncharacterized protein DIURU_003293 [Diutina rugosa]KAA8901348.1 hypothetical protein DIURU_003293 [Diutina rugosa]
MYSARLAPRLLRPVGRQFTRNVVYQRAKTNGASTTSAASSSSAAAAKSAGGNGDASEPSAATPSTTSNTTNVTPGNGLRFNDEPLSGSGASGHSPQSTDWSESFHGLGSKPFDRETIDILLAPISDTDIEIKPDGLLYLPEIKYRRILNRAFGPGGWGLAPRTESLIIDKQISREYALICEGRLVSIARGEQDFFGGNDKVTTALEGCKSNALMRCCKDLGIASELWDPQFIRKWKQKYCEEVFVEHVGTKKKKKIWKLKSTKGVEYPYKAL